VEDKSLVLTLEDGKEYLVLDKIGYHEEVYIYLVSVEDSSDFCIRKRKIQGDEEFLIGLQNDQEFDFALGLFADVHPKEKQ